MSIKEKCPVEMTPLERARQRAQIKTCLTCEDRAKVGGASYCGKDGKLLHPMLLDPVYPSECPIEIERRNQNGRYNFQIGSYCRD